MKIAIVTDSTADLPKDLASELEICVIPANLIIDGKSYEDGGEISRAEFYEQLPAMINPPTTAAPSSGKFQQCYEQLFQNGAEKILSIHVSGELSGIINSAQAAAHRFEDRVEIIDSEQVTLGLGFQVLEAARAVQEGASYEHVIARVESVRQRIRLIALIDTLEYLRRSGRVSWARASVSSLLQIKPLIELKSGKVGRIGEVRTRKKGIERLYGLLSEAAPFEQLAILHSNAETDAVRMADAFRSRTIPSPLIINVTTVIGTHVGQNGLGFVVVRTE